MTLQSEPRRRLLLGAGLAALLPSAWAQTGWPAKPVRIISPYTAGGLGDILPRALASVLQPRIGQPVLVDNKPGASQVLGAQAAMRSEPDGLTLFWASTTSMAINPIAQKKLPYDPLKDFAPIAICFTAPLYLIVRPSLPVKSVQELVAYARANPGKVTFASGGNGSTNHLAGELFAQQAGVKMLHVPYKGAGGAITDLMAGTVDIMFEGNGVEYARKGQLRALAVASNKRTRAAPELPTIAEAGVPGCEVGVWFGLAAPAATPQPLVERIATEVQHALVDPELARRLPDVEITPSTPQQMAAQVRADTAKWRKVIAAANVTFD
ncbi:tripartite tricarboxylate transporter substrate binding protein [Ramlibacter sp. G-1-2-2]|uniref:Tripartite tricarboxylate transporter substrate binding protein n=1 Tax=Ramlibacter agri TaxID=2728837 RepID=A0A848H753_9BURK|nr:tripartite tricarboxylate transporter substrate binding protein [Ramlibacter agri]NML45339.1 tripartite tricarboxylate transporter substrate binding protein [Ramlibacter agri]